jgi:hypothetical protein
MTFDPRAICGALNDEGVDYVIIGGFAAAIHGSPLPTTDVDIVPSRQQGNLERLARALARLDAKLRTEAGPIAAKLDAGFLAAMPMMLNLTCKYGDIDLTFQPAGPLADFEEWNMGAREVVIAPLLSVRIASLEDVIDSKRAAGRDKDIRALPYLESLRDETDGRNDE